MLLKKLNMKNYIASIFKTLIWLTIFVIAVLVIFITVRLVVSKPNSSISTERPTSAADNHAGNINSTSNVTSIVLPTPAGRLLFSDNFDDGFAHNFDFYTGGWKVVDDGTGNKVLQMDSPQTCCADARFGPTNLPDGIVEFRFKVINTDYHAQVHVMEFSYRVSNDISNNATQYQLHYDPETSIINTIYQQNGGDWQPLEGNSGEGPIQGTTGGWITLRVKFQGENISVFINGNPFMTGLDTRINNGTLTLGANGPMIVQFDDLKVWDLSK